MAESNDFLPHFITEEIYVIKEEEPVKSVAEAKNVEMETPEPTPQIVEEPVEPISIKAIATKGENLKGTVVLVDTDAEVIGLDDEQFLLKIMGAVKRKSNDILIANVRDFESDRIDALLDEQPSRQVIGFGTTNCSELKDTTLYEPKVVGKQTFLRAEALGSISQDDTKKRALWSALQSIFLS